MKKDNRISVVDDESSILEVMKRHLEERGYEVRVYMHPQEAVSELGAWKPNLVITDLRMDQMNGLSVLKSVKKFDPEVNVIMMTAYASVDSAVSAIRNGATDYIIKPFKLSGLDTSIQRAFSETRFMPGVSREDGRFSDRYKVRNLIGTSGEMQKVYDLIKKSARTSTTVLITGESGTGKELVARAIHYNSRRKDESFVGINCAALPENLLESELFGHEKGSFTGAVATKIGLMELAQRGTFFLDEAAEISPVIQAKLLRVLQERVIKRVGGLEDIPVDVRIIAATSRNLEAAVEKGVFRHELYYRLNVIPITLPPLRNRKDDIPVLVEHFASVFSKKMNLERLPWITEDAVKVLKEHDWPGNVRELENVIERILALSENGSIDRAQVEEALPKEKTAQHATGTETSMDRASVSNTPTLKEATDAYEKGLIRNALASQQGNKLKAAKLLGLTRQSLQYKLKKYDWK